MLRKKQILITVIILIIGALFKVKISNFRLLPQYLEVLKMLIVSNMKLVQSFDQYLGHQTADVYSATHGMSASLSVDDTAIHPSDSNTDLFAFDAFFLICRNQSAFKRTE